MGKRMENLWSGWAAAAKPEAGGKNKRSAFSRRRSRCLSRYKIKVDTIDLHLLVSLWEVFGIPTAPTASESGGRGVSFRNAVD